jgi:hypothetical protein
LQNEFFPVDDDGVPGVVSAGIASYYLEGLRKDVDNFALALVAPLGADNDSGSASIQFLLRTEIAAKPPRIAHTRIVPRMAHQKSKKRNRQNSMCTLQHTELQWLVASGRRLWISRFWLPSSGVSRRCVLYAE